MRHLSYILVYLLLGILYKTTTMQYIETEMKYVRDCEKLQPFVKSSLNGVFMQCHTVQCMCTNLQSHISLSTTLKIN